MSSSPSAPMTAAGTVAMATKTATRSAGVTTRIRRAAVALASERYLLDEDIALAVALAARAWDHWTA